MALLFYYIILLIILFNNILLSLLIVFTYHFISISLNFQYTKFYSFIVQNQLFYIVW